jgi:hypothetical protein
VALREALLRPEYREWYPGLKPGIWYNANWVTEAVMEQHRSGEPTWAVEGRLPSDAHFTFRGGRPRSPGEPVSRRTDRV